MCSQCDLHWPNELHTGDTSWLRPQLHHYLLDLGKRIILQSPNFLKCKIKEGLHSVIHMSVPLQIIHPSPGILLSD